MIRLGQDLICFGLIHSFKIRSLADLSCAGFPIVPTLCFDANEWPGQEQLRAAALWPEQLPLYVRICFDAVEYPHSFYRICKWNELQQTVHILSLQASELTRKPCDITIQPLLLERFGGAVAALRDMLIIEAVDGNARGLLREGQFSSRAVLCGSRLIAEISGGQRDALFWSGNGYQLRAGNPVTWQDLRVLSTFPYSPSTLYEFCVIQTGAPFFLEAKRLPENTFFFDGNGVFTIYSSKGIQARQFFPLPLLSLRGQLKHNQLHIFDGGAYLSHLSVFAAAKQIPMCFAQQIQQNEQP